MNKYEYFLQALDNYCEISYGQFDMEYKHHPQITKDAAEIIRELLKYNTELKNTLEKILGELKRRSLTTEDFEKAVREVIKLT
jgi:benzoyl-CoA reductase/2-hydroxyglutaryl-CoA dehydratase subunit BcrC/BadD/HgdB